MKRKMETLKLALMAAWGAFRSVWIGFNALTPEAYDAAFELTVHTKVEK